MSFVFFLQVSNLFLPPGFQRLATAGSDYSMLRLAGWEYSTGGVNLGCEEFGHCSHGNGGTAAGSTLHSSI